MPGVIGGSSLIAILGDDGEILFFTHKELELLVEYGRSYDVDARYLLWKFLDQSFDLGKFKDALDHFSTSVMYWRKEWEDKRARIVFSTPPAEANEAILDLRTKVPPNPPPPTGGS